MENQIYDIEGIIFDLDGTLLDTEPISDMAINMSIEKAYNNMNNNNNNNNNNENKNENSPPCMNWEIKKKILGMRSDKWSRIVLNDLNIDYLSPETLADEWEENSCILCSNVEKMPGVNNIINIFDERNIPMAIATSSGSTAVASKRLNHDDIFNKMRLVVTGDDPEVEHGKPAPDIYLLTANRLNLNPSKCLVFEDSISGVKSGKAAGMIVIAIPDPRLGKTLFHEADIILNNLNEFDINLFNFENNN